MKFPRNDLLPWRLLVLDLIGSAVFTLGLLKLVLDFETLPSPLRFDHYGWALIALGVALWFPALLHIAIRIRDRLESTGRFGAGRGD